MKEDKQYFIKELGLKLFNDLEDGKISYFELEKYHFKDMKCKKDVEYNNLIIREINKHFKPNQYKLSEYLGLIF